MRLFGGDGGDDGRIEAAGEEGPDRHIGREPPLDRLFDEPPEFAGGLVERLGQLERVIKPPVAADRGRPVVEPEFELVPRRKLVDVPVNGARPRHVLKRKIVADRVCIEFGRHGRVALERREFAGEDQRAAGHEIEQRLLPHAVAPEQHTAALAAVYGEGEHPFEHLDAFAAELLVEMDDHLCVAFRAEFVAAPEQLFAQLAVVVDFAVEDGDDAAVLVRDRLAAFFEVDDRKAAVTEGHIVVEISSRSVRAPVDLALVHCGDDFTCCRIGVVIDDSGNSAHGNPDFLVDQANFLRLINIPGKGALFKLTSLF